MPWWWAMKRLDRGPTPSSPDWRAGRVVERFDEAVAAARLRRLEPAQVGGGAVRRDLAASAVA